MEEQLEEDLANEHYYYGAGIAGKKCSLHS